MSYLTIKLVTIDDIATANYGSRFAKEISLLFGQEDGTFGAEVNYALNYPYDPSSIWARDLNGDGNKDLVVGSQSDLSPVAVRLNNGNGTFGNRVHYSFSDSLDYTVGNFGSSLVVEDLNGDGVKDLILGTSRPNNTANLIVGYSRGDGSFERGVAFDLGLSPDLMAVADLNQDGLGDLIFTQNSYSRVYTRLNNGDGSFAPARIYGLRERASDLSIVDVNGDELWDLAVLDGEDGVSLFLGTSNGNVVPEGRYLAGMRPQAFAWTDLDLDKDLEVITINSRSLIGQTNFISILPNQRTENYDRTHPQKFYTYDPTFNQITSYTDELGRLILKEIDPNNGNLLSTTRVVGEIGGDDDITTSYT